MTSEDRVVLVIEDERDVAEAYELWLGTDYDVRVAMDGETGLEKLDDEVDVVLLDRRMPGMSGDEVLERIKECEEDPLVVMVTAVEPGIDIIEMGFDAYLTKPVGRSEVFETIDRLLDRETFDDHLREYYSLVEKQATLEAELSPAQLEESEEYEELDGRIEAVEERIGGNAGGVDSDQEFVALVRDIDEGFE